MNCFAQESEYKTPVFLSWKKTLNIFPNNKCFYATHVRVLSCIILLLFCLLEVNINLLSLKINASFSIMVTKSSNSCIALCNYIITIYVRITSILTTQVLLKYGDIEINLGSKKLFSIKFCNWNLIKRTVCSWLWRCTFNRDFNHCEQSRHLYACLKPFYITQYLTMMKILTLTVTHH